MRASARRALATTRAGRRAPVRHVCARWTAAWLAGPVIGVANGATREWTYQERVGELTAHQISTATGIAFFGLYFWARAPASARARSPPWSGTWCPISADLAIATRVTT